MSERKVDTETVPKQYTNDASLIDEVEIIDVSACDFDDTDGWLYTPPQCCIDTSIQNLYAWLKSESDLILPGNRRSIDTRTFTRPKKRNSRINIESILEAVSPPISNTWKTGHPSLSHIGEDLHKQLSEPAVSKEESVPPMLKVAPNTNINYLPDDTLSTSGQESMEIFFNMSHSKGIDSFINLVEPGLNEPLMNVSQPSIFYSSITSLPRDDCSYSGDYDTEDVPANLTHTFSQRASIHEDVKDLNVNETFSMVDEPDNNKTHCLPADRTFNQVDMFDMNETYTAEPISSTVVLSSGEEKNSTINLSSTLVNKYDGLRSENDKKDRSSTMNATYSTAEAEKEAQKQIKRSQASGPLENIVPKVLMYNTYKKQPSRPKAQIEMSSDAGVCAPNAQDKKYYTFTKKGNVHGGKTDMENAEYLENVDATFTKPLLKLQKKKQQQHIPRMLSKLPQFLQKSNPNLVSSSLKIVGKTGCPNATGVGYMKGSQPNIVEKTVTNKLYALGKIKSGSEQRLLELNTELQIMGAGGSTESIESTQSAHSAPDLDDRLSTCSDSSHNSYTVQPMNIEQLHQIVRMQEESLKQDATPLLNRRVMDNTWTELKKGLLSPIPKNGSDGCESDTFSLTSMDFNVKTSSPLISPTRSTQSVNADDHSMGRVLKQHNETDVVKKAEVFNKPAAKCENKTRLRPPTNWSTGNRPANTLSAIPRPASRIPGPRAIRPSVKTTQSDVKRGYM